MDIFFTGLALGVALGMLGIWLWEEWDGRRRRLRQDQARNGLRDSGYRVEMYLPALGISDPRLRDHLETMATAGYIVRGPDGRLLGQTLPEQDNGGH